VAERGEHAGAGGIGGGLGLFNACGQTGVGRRAAGVQPIAQMRAKALRERREAFDDLFGGFHERSALANQPMTAARQRIVDRTRNREHVAALFARVARGDQRARSQACFDDERSESETRDDPVAPRKIFRPARCARRKFADERAVRCDACGEFLMLGGIDDIGPRAEHGDRHAACVERRRVRRAIDAFGEAARDRESRRDERTRKTPRVIEAGMTRAAAADDRDLRAPQRRRVAGDEQRRGRARRVAQQRGKVRVVETQQLMILRGEPFEIGRDARGVGRVQPIAAGCVGDRCFTATRGLQRFHRTAMPLDEGTQSGCADSRCTQQDQPRFDLGAVRVDVHACAVYRPQKRTRRDVSIAPRTKSPLPISPDIRRTKRRADQGVRSGSNRKSPMCTGLIASITRP